MGVLRQYALTLIIGALICGILLGMVQKGAHEALLRFLCGMFLTVTLLAPLPGIHLEPELDFFGEVISEGEIQTATGKEMAQQELRRSISRSLEAYILDKAGQLDAQLQVSVTLDENCLPVTAELSGKIPEEVQKELSDILTNDLGIPKENQQWIG